MRRDEDEINPFSREYTTRQSGASEPEPTPASPPPRGRGNGNWWLWLIPLLAGVILLPLLCCGGFLLFGVGAAVDAMGKPIDAAIAAIEADQQCVAKLGKPVEQTSSFGVSEYHYDNGNGSAEVDFNIEGPDGSARVKGTMKLIADVWSPEDLTITFQDGTVIQLPATIEMEAGESF